MTFMKKLSENTTLRQNIYSFITVFLWASAFPLTKSIDGYFSPYSLGLLRCFTASLLLIILAKAIHIRKPFCKKHIMYFTLSGALGFSMYMIFFNVGLIMLTSATSSIIIAATPIFTAIAASILYKEKISIAGWISILFAFSGVIILLFWNGIFSINIGVIWTLAASAVFCGYNLMNRKLAILGYTSGEIVTYSMIAGTILLLGFLPQTITDISNADLPNIAAVIYLGIMPSGISYILWAMAINSAKKTSEVTNYMFVTPLLSAVMGFLMLKEIPDMGTFIGGIIIITSVVFFSYKGK